MTLLDSWDKFTSAYIKRSSKKSIPKEDKAFVPSEYGAELRKYTRNNLTPEKRRELALGAPLYMKGVNKKSADKFRAWFTLENMKTRAKASQTDETIIRLFDRLAKTKQKIREADRCSHIYGDGFILIRYAKDNTSGENGTPDLSLPPTNARPVNLRVLDPERSKEFKFKNETWQKKGIAHVYYVSKEGDERWIHPDRILHIARNKLPFQMLGTSDIDILLDVILSYSDITVATGEILKWFAHGVITLQKANMQPNEKRDIEKELEKHNNIFVNDERYTFDVKNPEAIDPKPFYDFVQQNIAAVLGMPTHMLTGVVAGRTTGAETAYSDYYRDVADDQELLYTPLVIKLYTQLLGSYNRPFKYNIAWNQIYINELAEADLIGKRGAAGQNLKGAGIIDNTEARQIVNKGLIELDPNKKIKQPTTPTTNVPVQPDKRLVKSPKQKDDDED